MSEEALSVLRFWWACIEAGRQVDGEPPLSDDDVILHYCANGATAMVTAGHFRAIGVAPYENTGRYAGFKDKVEVPLINPVGPSVEPAEPPLDEREDPCHPDFIGALAPAPGFWERAAAKLIEEGKFREQEIERLRAELRDVRVAYIPENQAVTDEPAAAPNRDLLESIANWFEGHPNADLEPGGIELLRQYLDGLRKMVARCPVETVVTPAWQPAETAPRDGSEILGCLFNGRLMVVVFWEDEPVHEDNRWATADGIAYHKDGLTHWMPLPTPPAVSEADK